MLEATLTAAVSLFALLVLLVALGRWRFRFLDCAARQGRALDAMRGPGCYAAIVAAAALSLFLELAVIRWQVSVFPLLAFYKNFGLLACFAGLGLGYALSKREQVPLVLVAPLLGVQCFLQVVLKQGLGEARTVSLLASPIREELAMGLLQARTDFQYLAIYGALAIFFALSALAMIPVGQLCGRLMTRTTPLRAYGLNLLGSLAGVALMFVMSAYWTPPLVWFALALGAAVLFVWHDRWALAFSATASLLLLLIIAWPGNAAVDEVHSPYQLIEKIRTADGLLRIRAAGHFFQDVLDNRPERVDCETGPERRLDARMYELPYRAGVRGGRIAVLGAGTGNDVAAALRMGAEQVDAVEIDPVIVALGKTAHPEGPYTNPKVRCIVDDARTYLRKTEQTYDAIVYGLLDSHTVLSQAASLRLDSFVYTVEGFRAARAHLKDEGLICLSFLVLSPELGQKIFDMLEVAFDGRPPRCFRSTRTRHYLYLHSEGADFAIAPDVLADAEFEEVTADMVAATTLVDPSTDDWPFFYMPRRVFPWSYLGMGAIVFGVTLVLLLGLSDGVPTPRGALFFLLGAGFMLVETKGITELGLNFGNTWQVIGIVIASILFMAFLANCAVSLLRPRSVAIPLLFVLLSLLVGYSLGGAARFGAGPLAALAAVLLLACPVFFSGMVFSAALDRYKEIPGAMSANLLGAMCGGILEYGAMRFGYLSLYLLAAVLYLLAGASLFLARPKT